MSEIAATLGLPATFQFEGRELKVAPRDLEMEGLFELWMENEAAAYVQRHAPDYRHPEQVVPGRFTPVEHSIHLQGLRHDAATRIYAFDGPAATMARMSTSGAKQMALIQLQGANEGVDLSLIDRLWEDEAARMAFQNIQAQVGRDPNRNWARPTKPA